MQGLQHQGVLGAADRPHVWPVGDSLERDTLECRLAKAAHLLRVLWTCEAILPVQRLDRPRDGAFNQTEKAMPLEGALGVSANLCVPTLPCFYKHDRGAVASAAARACGPVVLLWGPQRQVSQHLACKRAGHTALPQGHLHGGYPRNG